MPSRVSGRTLARLAPWLSSAAVVACAPRATVTRIQGQTYRVDCAGELGACLAPVAKICEQNGYDVIGSEKRDYSGPRPEGYEVVQSSATVRCREPKPLFGADSNTPLPTFDQAAAPAVARPPGSAPPAASAPLPAPPPAVAPTVPSPAPPAKTGAPTSPAPVVPAVDAGAP